VLLCLQTKTEPASEMSCLFKKLDIGLSPNKENCELIPVMLCSPFWISWLLYMGSIGCHEMMVWNFHSILCNISDDLAMQDLVWLQMVQFLAIRFGAVWFSASYANLGQRHIFKAKFKAKTSSCI
jgi:hypothetical protein